MRLLNVKRRERQRLLPLLLQVSQPRKVRKYEEDHIMWMDILCLQRTSGVSTYRGIDREGEVFVWCERGLQWKPSISSPLIFDAKR